MQDFKLKRTARLVQLALLPAACFSLLSACATYESAPAPVAASANLPSPGALQDYRAVRASDLIGKTVRNQNGVYMGQVQDLVLQMGTGAVRYAIVSSGGDPHLYALPVHTTKAGAGNDIVIDLQRPRLADYRNWTTWPDMHDAAYWSELDRVSGFQPVQPGHGYDRLSALRGKLVVGANGEHLGHVEDLVINASTDVVHYAIVALEPGRVAGGRLVAVPLHAFGFPREGVNRLALRIDSSRLAQLETFDAARWAQLNNPAYVVHMDRYLVSAFPAGASPLFEQLDTNRDGFLSRAELGPLQMAGTDRYALRGPIGDDAAFRALDRDGDGFLNKSESQSLLRDASFARFDTNGDGFISRAEAAPLLGSSGSIQTSGVTFDQLDRDHDGFVNRAEAGVLLPPATVTAQQVVVQPVVTFETLDVDRDGYLNRMEAATLLNRMGGASSFDRYDSNRDGFLSRAELDTFLRQQNVGGTTGQPVEGSIGTR
jgi:sporulation protein YlmC with PRC-barrel domain/Ca2+-binding EF-hand superfamily protein